MFWPGHQVQILVLCLSNDLQDDIMENKIEVKRKFKQRTKVAMHNSESNKIIRSVNKLYIYSGGPV